MIKRVKYLYPVRFFWMIYTSCCVRSDEKRKESVTRKGQDIELQIKR
jgi:hypothetical protein